MSSLDRSPSDGTRWEAPSMARSRGGEVVHRRGLRPAGWRGLRGGSRVAAMPGTWRANEYLVVSFLVGTATFTLLLTAICLGVGLLLIWVGLPILVATAWATRRLAGLERLRTSRLLGEPVGAGGPGTERAGGGAGRRGLPAAAWHGPARSPAHGAGGRRDVEGPPVAGGRPPRRRAGRIHARRLRVGDGDRDGADARVVLGDPGAGHRLGALHDRHPG